MQRRLILLTILFLAVSPIARADDWPNYRGPHHDGVSVETGWTSEFPSSGPTVLWKWNVGIGFSSFAVAKNRLYTAGNVENTCMIVCLDALTGKPIWKHSFAADIGDRDFEGGSISTPAVDGDRVFALGRYGDLFCFDAASGKVVWQENIHAETKIRVPDWGFGGSPLVMGSLLLLNVGKAGVAMNKTTGKVVWKSENEDAGYSTPVPMMMGDKSLLVLSDRREFSAVDVQTGKEFWHFKWVTQYGANAADPIVDGDRVLISSGYGKGAALLQSAEGEPKTIWKSRVLRSHLNPPVKLGDYVYGIDGNDGSADDTSLKCVEFATGKERWSQAGLGGGSLIIADGKLIVLNEKGELSIAPASPDDFKPTAHAQVLSGKCWTSPVLANGLIYCRNATGDVVCLDVRKK